VGDVRLSWGDEPKDREEWICEVGAERLSWGDESKTKEEWKRWKYWSYIENTKEQFDLEELIGLITKPHMLTVPDEIGMAVDSKDNLWITYRANDGAIYLARANDTIDGWVYHEQLLYVPSGSTYPTIAFDNNDRHVIAVEFLPAGSDQKEIWLYEPPYSGDGVRRIADGQYPVLAKDQQGIIHLFYQVADQTEIGHRTSGDNFAPGVIVPENDLEYPYPAGFRTIMNQYKSYLEYKYILFSNQVGNVLPRYSMTNYTAVSKNDSSISAMTSIGGLQWEFYAFYVTIELRDYFRKTPIEDAVIIFRGQVYVTDAGGKIDLGLIGAYPSDTILIQHADYPATTFEFQITEDTDYVFEVLGALEATESLNASPVVTGIEWEYMLKPLHLLVYSGVEIQQSDIIYNTPNDTWAQMWNPVTYTFSGTSITITGPSSSLPRIIINESIGLISDGEILVKCRSTSTSGNQLRVFIRAGGMAGSEQGYYADLLSGTHFQLRKYVNGANTTFLQIPFSWSANTSYWMKLSATGSQIKTKVWQDGQVEPEWMIEADDDEFSEGYAGVGSWSGTGIKTFEDIFIEGSGYERVYIPVPNATVQFGGQTSQTNQNGLAPFYELRAGDLHEYEITHPDYEVINTGKLLIPEGTDIVLPVQMFHDLPNYPCEVVSANPEISLVEWVDARYTVTIRVVSYETGTTMAGSSVVFAGETKITDENGEAVFHLVKPFPTVNLYEIQIDEFPVANVRVTGHESTREITILIQAGAETVPKAVADFAEMVPNITSILWVEVE
jgi:hypothetical protein